MLGVGAYSLQRCSNDITNFAISSSDGNNTATDYHLVSLTLLKFQEIALNYSQIVIIWL